MNFFNAIRSSFIKVNLLLLVVVVLLTTLIRGSIGRAYSEPDDATSYISAPNTETGLERFLGIGVVVPYPYFQKPRYRYPVYDREGRGYLSYGYGGKNTYKYTKFNKLEGHH